MNRDAAASLSIYDATYVTSYYVSLDSVPGLSGVLSVVIFYLLGGELPFLRSFVCFVGLLARVRIRVSNVRQRDPLKLFVELGLSMFCRVERYLPMVNVRLFARLSQDLQALILLRYRVRMASTYVVV